MAERRMFSLNIVDTDRFLEMPISTQALYFHLGMRADDEGFVNAPKKIQRMIGASDDDLKLLIAKGFVISFPSGIVVITHWKIHNSIQKDRFHATMYTAERKYLDTEGKVYELLPEPIPDEETEMETECIQNESKTETEVRLGKVRLDQCNKYTDMAKKVILYLNEKTGSNYSANSKKNISLIAGWMKEIPGLTFEDFQSVIDNKTELWLKDKKMSGCLRPLTLFGEKFENYLHEPKPKVSQQQEQQEHSFDLDEFVKIAEKRKFD